MYFRRGLLLVTCLALAVHFSGRGGASADLLERKLESQSQSRPAGPSETEDEEKNLILADEAADELAADLLVTSQLPLGMSLMRVPVRASQSRGLRLLMPTYQSRSTWNRPSLYSRKRALPAAMGVDLADYILHYRKAGGPDFESFRQKMQSSG